MGAAAAPIGIGLTAFGISESRKGAKRAQRAAEEQARQQQFAAEVEAVQLEQSAGQSKAASQRAAISERKDADLVASRALALAAASGGSATDPTIVRLIAGIKGEGSYRAAVALYRGEDQARKLRMGAKMARLTGDAAAGASIAQADAYQTAANTALIQGGATLFSRYGGLFDTSSASPGLVPEMVAGQYSTVNPAYG